MLQLRAYASLDQSMIPKQMQQMAIWPGRPVARANRTAKREFAFDVSERLTFTEQRFTPGTCAEIAWL
jgi:hypothetical protein